MNGNEGVGAFARVLQSRMHMVGAKPQTLDFGQIQSDGSLVTNSFPPPIPKTDYMICSACRGSLKSGDRVLVAWVGDDACVVDRVLPGTEG